ncbi:MAG: FlhC family transcriptional regulator [Sedimenticolaceae bacterium]
MTLSGSCDFAAGIWPTSTDERLTGIPTWTNALASLDAIRLIQLGARAGLVSNVTGIEKTVANRLYRQIHGRPSPPGLTPFTDTWFLKNDRRMLQAAVVWRLYGRIRQTRNNAAKTLIDLYEIYRTTATDDLLDFTHVAFVPRLIEMKLWQENQCGRCATAYITPIDEPGTTCPGCRLYQRYRCYDCGAPAEGDRKGRRRATCRQCGEPRLK